jgi:hypothetical protein
MCEDQRRLADVAGHTLPVFLYVYILAEGELVGRWSHSFFFSPPITKFLRDAAVIFPFSFYLVLLKG